MLKARNILIVFIINYMVMFLVSAFIDLWKVEKTVSNILTTLDMASDLAFSQVQAVEEVLGGKDNTLTLKLITNEGNLVEKPLFEVINKYDLYNSKSMSLGVKVKDEIDLSLINKKEAVKTDSPHIEKDSEYDYDEDDLRKEVFEKLYVSNDDFKNNITFLNKSYRPVRYYTSDGKGFTWYYIPNIALMGYSIFGTSKIDVYDESGLKVSETFAKKILDYYGLRDYQKDLGDGKSLYLTPLNMGITYINKDLLNVLFTNNLQLLMASKYGNNIGKAYGVLKGEYYGKALKETNISMYNPINNGDFTVLLGLDTTVDGVKLFKGVSPEIEYKVIDMYDSRNDPILKRLFGSNMGSYPTKADYLRSLDRDIINPVTGAPYDKKLITVAKVKFYVHVLIPYRSLFVLDYMRFKDNVNYFSVGDNVMVFEITKLYAVKP